MKKYFLIFIIVMLFTFVLFTENSNIRITTIPATIGKVEPGPDLRPFEWAWLQRTFPHFEADPTAHLDAILETQKLRREQKNKIPKAGNFLTDWEFAGPVNVSGRVVDIEFNPQNSSIVYAAAATGGVFKSTDMGGSWFPIFDEQSVLTIGDIGIDPVNPDIIYVGTGEANGGHNNFPGGGVFKSTDAGQTWQHIGLELTASIGRIVIDPSNTQRVFVAAVGSYFSPNPERGVYLSNDGGITWNQNLFISDSTGAIDIVMDPNNPLFMYAAMWERVRRPNSSHLYGPTGGIYRTTDGGVNWTALSASNGLPNPSGQNIGRIGLAMSISDPNITYALYNNGSTYTGLYKTTDSGDSWVNVDTDFEIDDGTSSFSWYFGQVRVHPTDPDFVCAMDVAFMRSTDGGDSWPIIYGYGGPGQLHVDHHALAFHPDDPNIIFNGNDGGINISTDGGSTWSNPAHLPITQFYEIGVDYNNPQRLYGGTQDNGTNRTLTGNWDDWQHIYGGDGFYVNVDFTDPDFIYAESQFGNLGRSTNGGQNWLGATSGINSNERTNWSTPVVMDPNDSDILYYGTNRVYRTTNRAQSWSSVSDDLTSGTPSTRLGSVTTIAVAPTNSNVIYAGTDDSHVWVTNDYGVTWTDISATLPYRWVTRVVVDPVDENIIYVTFSGLKWKDPEPHIFRSDDMGQTWTDISGNLPDAPVNAFAVDLIKQNVLYAGLDIGAFLSYDLGETWEVLGTGLPMVTVYDMKIHPVDNYLVVGTHARSMYKIDLNQVVGVNGKGTNNILSSFELNQNYPNPFNPNTVISYQLAVGSNVTLKVFDALGKEVATLVNEERSAGNYEVQFDGRNLSSGVYFYSLRAGDYSQSKKMLLLK